MILGVTPARGGSKGILRKNIKMIAGKPLLAWTIEAAKKSKLLDRYIISTEDNEISEVAREFDVEVLKRPEELADDTVVTIDVLGHVIEKIPCDIVVVLMATSPIRRDGLIDECIKEFIDKGYDSLATGFICKYTEYGKNELRRQDIPGFFCDDGNIYILKSEMIKNKDRYGRKIKRKIVSRMESIDIDEEFDFWLAEKVLLEKARNNNV